jgi:hypothetical protein
MDTADIRNLLSEDDAKTLATLHGAPPGIAAATLELASGLHGLLIEWMVLEKDPDRPHLIQVTPEGWKLIEELAAEWSEQELVEYFAKKTAEIQGQMP